MNLSADEIQMLDCLLASGPLFVISGLVTATLLAVWVHHRHELTVWQTILVMCGLRKVQRTPMLNVLHSLTVTIPFVPFFIMASDCYN